MVDVYLSSYEITHRGTGVHGMSQLLREKGINPEKSFTSKKKEGGITYHQDDRHKLPEKGSDAT
jgi:hypothetical protein